MRRAVSFFAIGLCMLIAHPAASARAHDPSLATDISAAKKKEKQQKKHVRHQRGQSVPSAPLAAQRGWFDPSLGPDGKPWPNPYPPGTCSTDMGYGRFSTCDFHE